MTFKSLDLSRTHISGDAGLASIHTPRGGSVDLASLQVGANLDLTGARLGGNLLGDNISVQRDLSLKDADLSDSQASFSGSSISGSADFSNLQSASQLGFGSMTVGGDLSLRNIRLDGTLQGNNLAVRRDIQFDDAVINGPVQLLDASIGNTLHLGGALFAGRVNASRLHVGADIIASKDTSGAPYGAACSTTSSPFATPASAATWSSLTRASTPSISPRLALTARLGSTPRRRGGGTRQSLSSTCATPGWVRWPTRRSPTGIHARLIASRRRGPGGRSARTFALDGLVYSRLGSQCTTGLPVGGPGGFGRIVRSARNPTFNSPPSCPPMGISTRPPAFIFWPPPRGRRAVAVEAVLPCGAAVLA